jgi:hypothetical protein
MFNDVELDRVLWSIVLQMVRSTEESNSTTIFEWVARRVHQICAVVEGRSEGLIFLDGIEKGQGDDGKFPIFVRLGVMCNSVGRGASREYNWQRFGGGGMVVWRSGG